MALPAHIEVTLPGGGVAVETALPGGDLIVTVGSNTVDVTVGWELDGGGAIVAPVALAATRWDAYNRWQAGGATSVYMASAAAGVGVVALEQLR